MKKNKVRVIRTAKQTIVIYAEKPREKVVPAPVPFRQKPVLVNVMGRPAHYIMPSGRILPIKIGRIWRVLKFVYPRAQFAAV